MALVMLEEFFIVLEVENLLHLHHHLLFLWQGILVADCDLS
jgi:hypothetical protein